MTYRITLSNVQGAFKRLHKAMDWPSMSPGGVTGGEYKANVGAIYLADNGLTFAVEQISNEAGGVHTVFGPWGTKRQAFETMAAQAQAVEAFKRAQDETA